MKTMLFLSATILLLNSVSACGWFTYEDIPDTRAYYNILDDLEGVQDSTLLISRYPTPQETKKNVYIPMNYAK